MNSDRPKQTFTKGKIWLVLSAIIVICLSYSLIDYRGPRTIRIKPDQAFGMSCLRARDLIVQEYDSKGNLWATRGMVLYRLNKNDNIFIRIAHIPTGASIFWLRNYTLVRRITVRPECIEVSCGSDGDILALSNGKFWYKGKHDNRFHETFRLHHYGMVEGQGIRNDGILRVNDSIIYFGEYFQNFKRENVRIFKSTNNGQTWDTAHVFKAGRIRHVHAIQHDPYSNKLWVCVGDWDHESMVAWSDDGLKTLNPIGSGSQLWRVCQLVFTEKSVLWGTDNSTEDLTGIFKWDRATSVVSKMEECDGAVFFGTLLSNGLVVFSMDREGFKNEKDNKTRMWVISEENRIKEVICGTWKHNKPGFRFKFALLRLQRNQGSSSLAFSVLNQKEFPDGDLVIIPENEIIKIIR